jgi:hypothetical protein
LRCYAVLKHPDNELKLLGRGGMYIGYWWESQMGRDHWEDQDVDGWRILKWILER